MTERVEVPDPMMLVVSREAVNPAGADLVNVTVPPKPFWGATVIVEVLVAPWLIVRVSGLAESVNVVTSMLILVSLVRLPLVPWRSRM